jgi:outer membrane lipoprotein-sorting protein
VGCGKYDAKDIVKDLSNKINKANSYYLEGKMEIYNNEDVYTYNVAVSYEKEDFFRVSLKNVANNHEQIILKNKDGVYVLTPSLNKTFKFQSEWPYNNSQVYLFQSILNDIKADDKKQFKEDDKYYTFTTTVNYPHNKNLKKQIVYLDKKLNIKEVHVVDENNNPQIKMQFNSVDMKATFNNDYFTLNKNMETAVLDDKTVKVSSIEEIVYPMYLPEETYLSSHETINKSSGERILLTFDGSSPFLLVEETASTPKDLEIVPTYGEPVQLTDTIGTLSEDSISWYSNGLEYYIVSDVLSQNEMLDIARSISAIPVSK